MKVTLDYNNMMADGVGNYGATHDEIEDLHGEITAAVLYLRENRGIMKWRELPYMDVSIVEDIENTAKDIQNRFENFVVLGIGGSALGPIAVQQALNHMRYNELPQSVRKYPKLYVEDNVDPERMASLLDVIDVKRTCFNVITKSGSTSETMAQLLIIVDLLKQAVGDGWANHVIATTDLEKGNLIKLSREFGLKTFYVPDGVGGRFSELCPVGLLPAAVCGIDIRALLAGAARMDEICSVDDYEKNPAYMSAVLQYLAMRKGMNISVMMPYADSLKYIADWYAQLWAESLGKQYDITGQKAVYTGQTPVKALGVTDQHSQVQLYVEGPFDKTVTFLAVENYRTQVQIPVGFENIPDIAFLGGHSLNELITAERVATEYALTSAGRPNMTITLDEVNAHTIGQLLYFFEVQTAFAGALLNINTFDQPGVEMGKNATYALLGKQGYDDKRTELEARPTKNPRYII